MAAQVGKYLGRNGYPEEIKMTVVQQWLALGNLKLVAANTEVPLATIKGWRGEPWWKDYEAELRAGRRFEVDKKLSKIIDRALDVIDDRLENGDFIFDQVKGEVVRRPVGIKDASTAATNLLQRQAVLEQQNKEEFNNHATKSIQDQLAMLATEFAKFNNRSKAGAETIEFKDIHAVHDQRKEGLQEGSGEVYEPPFSGEEAGGTEQSPPDDDSEGESPQG